jgi:GGDEF domain-containing protein
VNYKSTEQQSFLDRVDIELKRAERYRIFISMLVFDLSFIDNLFPQNPAEIKKELTDWITNDIRAIDFASRLEDNKLALFFPETGRQGAELASKRITDMIKEKIAELHDIQVQQSIAPRMASFPDAAGADSIDDFLKSYEMN